MDQITDIQEAGLDDQPAVNYAVVRLSDGVVVNTILWNGVGDGIIQDGHTGIPSDTAQIGWIYKDGEFSAPPAPPPTDEELSSANIAKLQQKTQLASAQKSALTERISTLNDAVEMEMATDEEIAELPARQKQLTDWKKYAILLGRVATQAGWPPKAEWPVEPTDGMDLSISSTAAPTS